MWVSVVAVYRQYCRTIDCRSLRSMSREDNSSKAFRQKQNAVQACLRLMLRPCLYRDSLKKGVKNSVSNCFLSAHSLNLIIQLGVKKGVIRIEKRKKG